MNIVKPITLDGNVGYDERNQLIMQKIEGKTTTLTFTADLRNKICKFCGRGWEMNGPAWWDQTNWYITRTQIHTSCLVRYKTIRNLSLFHFAICNAKLTFEELKPIPNRYWPDAYEDCREPWYEVKFINVPATMVIGARKRVFSISLSPTSPSFTWINVNKVEEAFKSEDVTKEFASNQILLHAWGEEKLREYVKKLGSFLLEAEGIENNEDHSH